MRRGRLIYIYIYLLNLHWTSIHHIGYRGYHTGANIYVPQQLETFSALLAICARNSPVTGEFPAQRPVTPSFDVFFGLRLNKRLSKQRWGWWFETPSCPLWRHFNVYSQPQPLHATRPPPGQLFNYFACQKAHDYRLNSFTNDTALVTMGFWYYYDLTSKVTIR